MGRVVRSTGFEKKLPSSSYFLARPVSERGQHGAAAAAVGFARWWLVAEGGGRLRLSLGLA